MSPYTIERHISPDATPGLPFCQSGFLFNEPAHLCQQRPGTYHLLTVVNQAQQQIDARCAFFIENHAAISPGAAPFGSIEFEEALPDEILLTFINQLFTEIKQAGCQTLIFVHYPYCYAPNQTSRLLTALLASGCSVTESHPTYYIPITSQPFINGITAPERRRLRKCQRAGFRFSYWQQPDPATVVSFLLTTYAQLGYQLSLPPERLLHLLITFPDQFSVFTLYNGVQLIALTVTVRVRHDILYNFLPASLPAYHAFSPMVMLLDGVYGYCQRECVQLLDLGMALDHDRRPKASLARFKRNLGAQESPKYVFRKDLQA